MADSLVRLGALVKGQSSAPALLRLARAAGVAQLVCCTKAYFRGAQSEVDVANCPSRVVNFGGAGETTAVHGARYAPQRLAH